MVGARKHFEKVEGVCDRCSKPLKAYGKATTPKRYKFDENNIVCSCCYNKRRIVRLHLGRTREERRQMVLDTICYSCKKTIAEAPGKDKKRCNYKGRWYCGNCYDRQRTHLRQARRKELLSITPEELLRIVRGSGE